MYRRFVLVEWSVYAKSHKAAIRDIISNLPLSYRHCDLSVKLWAHHKQDAGSCYVVFAKLRISWGGNESAFDKEIENCFGVTCF